jgi:hypothetical protein
MREKVMEKVVTLENRDGQTLQAKGRIRWWKCFVVPDRHQHTIYETFINRRKLVICTVNVITHQISATDGDAYSLWKTSWL